jgi:hypothetical protein
MTNEELEQTDMSDEFKAKTPFSFEFVGNFEFPLGSGNIAGTCWKRGALRVIRSIADMHDGSKWVHVSLSRSTQHPSWEDMVKVKENFIGTDADAIMVLPARSEHVNIHTHCFHWWHYLSGPRLCEPNLQNIKLERGI